MANESGESSSAAFSAFSALKHRYVQNCEYDDLSNALGMSPLLVAASENHVDVLVELLNRQVSLESRCFRNRTAFHYAALYGRAEVASLLHFVGARYNNVDNEGLTPLDYALAGNHDSVVKLLIENKGVAKSKFAMIHAIRFSDDAVSEYLIEQGATLDVTDKKGKSPLILATEKGRIRVVRCLVDHKVDVNKVCSRGRTALHYAAAAGHLDIVTLLLGHGSEANKKDEMGFIPLHLASREAKVSSVQILIDDSDVNATTLTGLTPLHYAVTSGSIKVLSKLLAAGADVDVESYGGFTPLNLAVILGYENIVSTILARNPTIDFAKPQNKGLLHNACMYETPDAASSFIGLGADKNEKDGNDKTPLFIALECGREENAEVLITNGADVNVCCTDDGLTALHVAAKMGLVKAARSILKNKGDLNAKTKSGSDSMKIAIHNGRYDVVKLFIESGYNIETVDEQGLSVLHWATSADSVDIATLLLSHDAKMDLKNKDGHDPLILAVIEGRCSLVNLFCGKGYNPNTVDDKGWTPLHFASRHGQTHLVLPLLVFEAQIDVEDKEKLTPLAVAALNGKTDTAVALLEAGCQVDAKSNEQKTPLFFASEAGNTELVLALIRFKADVKAKCSNNWTALKAAAAKGHTEVAKILLDNGAAIDERDGEGNTALHEACAHGHVDTLLVLVEHNANFQLKNKLGHMPADVALADRADEIKTALGLC